MSAPMLLNFLGEDFDCRRVRGNRLRKFFQLLPFQLARGKALQLGQHFLRQHFRTMSLNLVAFLEAEPENCCYFSTAQMSGVL
jgi:hypothetical protein